MSKNTNQRYWKFHHDMADIQLQSVILTQHFKSLYSMVSTKTSDIIGVVED